VDETHGRWISLHQAVPVAPGGHYRFRFDTRSEGVALDSNAPRFPNCWVGARFVDAKRTSIGLAWVTVSHSHWEEESVVARAPAGAAGAEIAFFLSMPGRLDVRRVTAELLEPTDSYDVLVEQLDRHYPFFSDHGIDWDALATGHRSAAVATSDAASFAQAIRPLLAALEDLHVSFRVGEGDWVVPGSRPAGVLGFQPHLVRPQLASARQVHRDLAVGRTPEGFGYVLVGSLLGTEREYEALEGAVRSLLDAPALIVDLRVCRGGQEVWGQRVASLLSGAARPYARSAWRASRAHDEFYETPPRLVPESPHPPYAGRLAVLIGPGCVSSGEGLALALRSIPGTALVGQPTRGASGNPQPLALPNGVTVAYSRWVSRTLDGTSIERRGIAPDVSVAPAAERDAALEAAREHLSIRARAPEAGDR